MASISPAGRTKAKKQVLIRELRMQRVQQGVLLDAELHNLKYRNTAVWGDGNLNPEIVFVKSFPTEQDYRSGKALFGRDRIYDDLLRSVGLNRSVAWFTYLVKYRPYQGREPRPYEVMHSQPHVDLELDVLKPRFVIPLGITPTRSFLPGQEMSKAKGCAHIFDDAVIVPIFDPEIVRVDPRTRGQLFEDFGVIRQVV